MKPILEHLAATVFLVLIIGYMVSAELKQRHMEQFIENQRKLLKRKDEKNKCCRRCERFIIKVSIDKNEAQGFMCEKNNKNCKPDDVKDCFEKRIGIE